MQVAAIATLCDVAVTIDVATHLTDPGRSFLLMPKKAAVVRL
jgi:hypothetical protein